MSRNKLNWMPNQYGGWTASVGSICYRFYPLSFNEGDDEDRAVTVLNIKINEDEINKNLGSFDPDEAKNYCNEHYSSLCSSVMGIAKEMS